MNKGNRDHHTTGLHEQAGPFERIHTGPAKNYSLPACIHCVFQARYDFSLYRDLSFALEGERDCELQCLAQCRRRDPQRCGLFRHRGPLKRNSFVNMAPDQSANVCFWFSRKAGGEQNHRPDRACFRSTSKLACWRLLKTSPMQNTTNRPKRIPNGGNRPADTCLKMRARSPLARAVMIITIPPATR